MERLNGSIIDCAVAPLPDGATLVTFVDVTATVHVERALKERNEALVQAGQLRENFVHHVSYQLRSPLTNVIGFTELLASGAAGLLTDRQSEYVGHVFESSNALMAIIDDILDLASFDRGEINLDRISVNIRDLVAAATDGLQDRIRERKIEIEVIIDEAVDTFELDAKRIRQILFNLLSNAIGFSSEGQIVTVHVSENNSNLILSVFDKGRGIPDEVIDRVFDRFETYTVGSKHRGVGLGLSIVKTLVELHGGQVSIESVLGEGTCVTCLFPVVNIISKTSEVA
jgi:signal transduction histidine kinase